MGLANQQDVPNKPEEKQHFLSTKIIPVIKNAFKTNEPFMALAIVITLLTAIGELCGRLFSFSWYIILLMIAIGAFYLRLIKEKKSDGK